MARGFLPPPTALCPFLRLVGLELNLAGGHLKGKNGENTFAAGVMARLEAGYQVRSEGRETGGGSS